MSTVIHHSDLSVQSGSAIVLDAFDPGFTSGFRAKREARKHLTADLKSLAALQDLFYADRRYALLIILQGMDTAGKDGAISHIMSGVNPQGVDVSAFKTPSARELSHDYLWRCATVLPALGRIAIFNRSYYEEVAIVRVHETLLASEPASTEEGGHHLWRDRFADINAFEEHLRRNGTIVLKFFLHVSKDEQRRRLLKRIDTPAKNWKFSAADVSERAFWDAYRHAYEKALTQTNTDGAPWYIIPADHKWFSRAAIANVIVARLSALRLAYPSLTPAQQADLLVERRRLESDGDATLSGAPESHASLVMA